MADQPNAVIDLDDLDDLSKVYAHPRRFALENLQVIWPSRSAPSATTVAIHFDVDGTGLSDHPRMAASRQFARARWRVPSHTGPNFGSNSPTACDPIQGRTAARHSVVVRKLTGAGHWRGPRPGNAICCPSWFGVGLTRSHSIPHPRWR
jgi:hypothetical protein